MRRNLNKCDESVKSAAYLGLACPKLEYASADWDPHLSKDINAIERVQRIAARWVISNYNCMHGCVKYACFLSCSGQHYIFTEPSQVTILYKGLHDLITLEIPIYNITTTTTAHLTRFQHPFHLNKPITIIIAIFQKLCMIETHYLFLPSTQAL